jgi:DNA-binding transcriptional LysR family regulator
MDIVLDDRNIDLIEEGIDVALRMGKLSDSTHTARKIAAARRVVIATPNYLARAGVPKAPGELIAHEAVIFTQPDGGVVWTFKRGDTELSVTANGRIQVSAAEGVRAAVLADAGLAVASEWMFSPELANGTVKTVLDDWEMPAIDLWAVFPTGRRVSSKARTFIDFVEEVMQQPHRESPARSSL